MSISATLRRGLTRRDWRADLVWRVPPHLRGFKSLYFMHLGMRHCSTPSCRLVTEKKFPHVEVNDHLSSKFKSSFSLTATLAFLMGKTWATDLKWDYEIIEGGFKGGHSEYYIYMLSGWEVIANNIYMFSGLEVIANNICVCFPDGRS